MTQVPFDSTLSKNIQLLNEYLSDPTSKHLHLIQPTLEKLYQQVWAPCEEHLLTELDSSIQTLLIIPHRELFYLPFEALRENRTSPYVIQTYQIAYALSASLWAEEQDRPRNPHNKLLAMAPYTGEGLDQNIVRAKQEKANPVLAALPYSKVEIEQISQAFNQLDQDVDIFLGKTATKAEFLKMDLSEFSFLHLATHGSYDKSNAILNGLSFFPDSQVQNQTLYLSEVASLSLAAEFVVLSACQTGLGSINRGEGVIGLTRAFMIAGARNVIASLWIAHDKASAELMTLFYQYLLQGTPTAEALRLAKIGLLQDPRFWNPKFWAPFVLF